MYIKLPPQLCGGRIFRISRISRISRLFHLNDLAAVLSGLMAGQTKFKVAETVIAIERLASQNGFRVVLDERLIDVRE